MWKEILYSIKMNWKELLESFLIATVITVLLYMTSSCTRVQYIPKEAVRIDSVYMSNTKRDSIYVQDSVYIHEKGDTIFVNKTKIRYIEKLTRDTIYRSKIDSVSVPYPVEKSLSWWDAKCMVLGKVSVGVLVLLMIGMCVYVVKRLYLR